MSDLIAELSPGDMTKYGVVNLGAKEATGATSAPMFSALGCDTAAGTASSSSSSMVSSSFSSALVSSLGVISAVVVFSDVSELKKFFYTLLLSQRG